MNLLVLGATGATGKLVVAQALDAGHDVRALVRSPEKLTRKSPKLEVSTGQATSTGNVARALESIDDVIVTLGASKGTVMTDATRALLAGAAQTGVKRVVVLSTFAMERYRLTTPAKLMSGMAMGAAIKDKSTAEQLLRSSDLDYTVVYATRLGNGPATATAKAVPESTPLKLGNSIARADVAAWLLKVATDGSYSRSSVAITG